MESTAAAASFAALAQETRLDLLRLLIGALPCGLPAGEIATRLSLPASTLSFHLAALERAGLTQSVRHGRQIIHAARLASIRHLLQFLTETCCGGQPGRCGDLMQSLPTFSEEDLSMSLGMIPAFNVLFLCTHNAARSIMAEAILTHLGRDRFHAWSAGSEPGTHPNPAIIEKLAALGHGVSTLRSKSWNEFAEPSAPRMDFVITLCDPVDDRACPYFGDRALTSHWPMPDPSKFTGNAVERAVLLNEVYAGLRRRIETFIALPFASLDRIALRTRLDEIGGGMAALAGR